MQQEETPTFLYRMFENTMNLFKSKSSTAPETTELQSELQSELQTPLQKEEQIFKNSISELKKISPKIKGSKLDYMIQRFEKEQIYVYI
jgi:hypothetical protein